MAAIPVLSLAVNTRLHPIGLSPAVVESHSSLRGAGSTCPRRVDYLGAPDVSTTSDALVVPYASGRDVVDVYGAAVVPLISHVSSSTSRIS